MRAIFISDLHLSPESINANQIFFSLLNNWQNKIDALYILGDFFDYWLGDDDDNQFIRQIKQALHNFSQTCPIYFIVGNHDFAIGKKFARETGISLMNDPSTINIANNKILISHGDVFCTLDIAYQRMKKIIRNPLMLFLLRRTPLSWRHKLKSKLEHKSTQAYGHKPKHTYHVVDESISKYANCNNSSIIIHGHTHHPGHYLIKNNDQLINRYEIPDWQDHAPGGYIEIIDDQINIVYSKSTTTA